MGKALKIIGGIVALLVGLLVVVALVLPSQVNRFKPQIEAQVLAQTGMTLDLQGDIGLSIYPFLGVAISDVGLLEPDGSPFVALRSLKASLALLPLLRGEVAVDQVLLDGLTLSARVDEKGRGNWQTILDTQAARPKTEEQPPATDPGQEAGGDLALAVSRVAIQDASLSYQDEQSGQSVSLSDIQLLVEDLVLGESFPLSLKAKMALAEPAMTLALGLEGSLQVAADFSAVRVPQLNLSLTVQGEPLGAQEVRLSLDTQADIDLTNETVELTHLVAGLNDLQVEVTGQVTGFATPRVSAQVRVPKVSPRAFIASLGQAVPATQDAKVLTSMALAMTVAASPEQVALTDVSLQLDDSTLNGKLSLMPEPLAVEGDWHLDSLDLRRYLPPESAAEQTSAKHEGTPAPPETAVTDTSTSGAHPLAALKDLLLDMTLQIGTLYLPGQTLTQGKLHVTAKNGILSFNDTGGQLNGEPARLGLRVDAREADQGRLSVNLDLAARLPDVALRGAMETQLQADAAFKQIALNPFKVNGQAEGKLLNGRKATFNLTSGAKLELAEEQLMLVPSRLSVNNLVARWQLDVKNFSQPSVTGEVAVEPFSARQLATSLGVELPPMADAKALSRVALRTRLAGKPNQIELQDVQVTLDQTTLSGHAGIDLGTQAITARLQGSAINLDRYLPPPEVSPAADASAAKAPETIPDTPRDTSAPLIPLDTVRALKADVVFELAQLTIKAYETSNMILDVQANGGLIELRKADAAMYDGRLTTRAKLDARTDAVQYEFSSKLHNVDTGKFPAALAEQSFLGGLITIRPKGRVNLDVDYRSSGNQLQSLLDNAVGSLALNLEEGAIEELKLLTDLYRLASMFREDVPSTADLVARTPFRDLATRFSLKGSQLSHDQYSLNLNKDATVQGSGKIDLAQRTLDYRFDLRATEHFAAKQKAWARTLLDVPIGYQCTADFSTAVDVACKRDTRAVEKLAKTYAEQRLKQEANKQLDRLLDKHLGGDDKATGASGEDGQQPSSEDALKDAGRELIKGLFR